MAVAGLAAAGDRAYVLDADSPGGPFNLQVVDLSGAGAPQVLGQHGGYAEAVALAAAPGRAYVAAGDAIPVIDAAGPGPGRPAGTIRFPPGTRPWRLAAAGQLLLAAGRAGTLHLVDAADADAPREVATLAGNGELPIDLFLQDGIAYLVAKSGVRLVDVARPEWPVDGGWTVMPGFAPPQSAALTGDGVLALSRPENRDLLLFRTDRSPRPLVPRLWLPAAAAGAPGLPPAAGERHTARVRTGLRLIPEERPR